MYSIRYEKHTPGHHVQVDVKLLIFNTEDGSKIKRSNIQQLTMLQELGV